jgi:hypothetical protein
MTLQEIEDAIIAVLDSFILRHGKLTFLDNAARKTELVAALIADLEEAASE